MPCHAMCMGVCVCVCVTQTYEVGQHLGVLVGPGSLQLVVRLLRYAQPGNLMHDMMQHNMIE